MFKGLNKVGGDKENTAIHTSVSQGTAKYKHLSLIERYALYLDMLQLIELKIKQSLITEFKYSLKEIHHKTLDQTLRLLHKEGLQDKLIACLKTNLKHRDQLIRTFWVDKKSTQNSGISIYEVDHHQLDQAIIDIECFYIVWDYYDIRQILK